MDEQDFPWDESCALTSDESATVWEGIDLPEDTKEALTLRFAEVFNTRAQMAFDTINSDIQDDEDFQSACVAADVDGDGVALEDVVSCAISDVRQHFGCW